MYGGLQMHDFPAPSAWLEHRVSYGETDCMGVMYYAEYFHLFERSRNEFIRRTGISYAKVEERGVILPVREASCRYRKPARYDDLLLVHIGLAEIRRASLRFVYEIMPIDKSQVLAEGMTQHAIVNRDLKPIAAPQWFTDLLMQAEN